MLKFLDNKRDRMIGFILTLLIVYSFTARYRVSLMEELLKITPYQLTYACQPEGYGNLILTSIIMTIIICIVGGIGKESIRKILINLGIGVTISAGCLIAYLVHCQLVLSTPNQLEPSSIMISSNTNLRIELDKNSPYRDQLEKLVRQIEAEDKDKQPALQEAYKNNEQPLYSIRIMYPPKYGISLWLILTIEEDAIYIQNGHSDMERTFCKDNGIRELVEQIVEERELSHQ